MGPSGMRKTNKLPGDRRPRGTSKRGRPRKRYDYTSLVKLELPRTVLAKIREIGAWEDRPMTDVTYVLLLFGLGVYERLVARLDGLLPAGCVTPQPSAARWVGGMLVQGKLLESEADAWIDQAKRWEMLGSQGRSKMLERLEELIREGKA